MMLDDSPLLRRGLMRRTATKEKKRKGAEERDEGEEGVGSGEGRHSCFPVKICVFHEIVAQMVNLIIVLLPVPIGDSLLEATDPIPYFLRVWNSCRSHFHCVGHPGIASLMIYCMNSLRD